MIRKLLAPVPITARPKNGITTRLAAALARPYQTGYTCPTLMTLSAMAYALRGYDVYWTRVRFDTVKVERDPSSVCYQVYLRGFGERYPSHGVELSCLFPDRAVLAERRLRDAAGRIAAKVVIALRTDSATPKDGGR